ncbi:transposase [Eubacterium ventriosum]|uniref:transposase n=1 Tax=Eubacterium ventriosum TaxID=39496 RepID=UPI000E5022BF|nr:hypothetical protein DW893_04860 [Eubacterium ventriosum]
MQEESHANILSEKGIVNRQTRSIQTEGYLGDIKENKNSRRFNYRSLEKVYREFLLFAIGRNIIGFFMGKYKKLKEKQSRKLLVSGDVLLFCCQELNFVISRQPLNLDKVSVRSNLSSILKYVKLSVKSQ